MRSSSARSRTARPWRPRRRRCGRGGGTAPRAGAAAVRQANGAAAAQGGAYYPSVSGTVSASRQKVQAGSYGIPGFTGAYFYNLDTAEVNVSYTLDAFVGLPRPGAAL